MNRRATVTVLMVAVLLLTGVAVWWWLDQRDASIESDQARIVNGVVQDDSGKQVLYWHDPMVPGQRFDKPGKSPFMDMQLVPQYAGDEGDAGVRISPNMVHNLGVRTGKVEVSTLKDPLVAVGRIAFDEHEIETIQTRTAGFIERLYVRAEGDPVKAGQKVAEVYAPELLAAQHELVALSRVADVPDIEALRGAARQRLRLLGMNDTEIRTIEKSATPSPRVGVYAPTAGIVRELGVREGAQVMPGQTIVQLAGLKKVWVLAELTERDSGRVRAEQSAEISVDAIPGQSFHGKVDYIYPQLDAASRTVRVRIEVANESGFLRPGMYARVQLAAKEREALTVPSEAVIETGTRKVVLVRHNDGFRPVEVRTAGEAGGRTEVLAGLSSGDEIVLSGQFLIDSEASLKGALSRLDIGAASDSPATTSEQATISGQGTIDEVAPARGVVTLTHDPIPELQWPTMTMEFKLRDPATAASLKPGTKARFEMKKQPEAGDYVIESIQIIDGSGDR